LCRGFFFRPTVLKITYLNNKNAQNTLQLV